MSFASWWSRVPEVDLIKTIGSCGAEGTRTPGLLHATEALFQLSYSPSSGGVARLIQPFSTFRPLCVLPCEHPSPVSAQQAVEQRRPSLQLSGRTGRVGRVDLRRLEWRWMTQKRKPWFGP